MMRMSAAPVLPREFDFTERPLHVVEGAPKRNRARKKAKSPTSSPTKLDKSFTAQDLLEQYFPDITYVVHKIIPEGLTMVVAAPKIGKSWMALGLAVANSNGSDAFGCIPTTASPVLYMALEDGPRRLQSRLHTLGVRSISPRLTFITDVAKEDMLATIAEYMALHPGENPIVILDTLGKAMPPAIAGETQYERDYRVVGALKACADNNPGSSVIIVHHTRKSDGADFVDAVSGTQGIAGAADTVLLLKRPRNQTQATLQVTSRDAAEGAYQLEMAGTGNWVLSGGSRESAARAAAEVHQTTGLGDQMTEIIHFINGRPKSEATLEDVAEALGVEANYAGTYLSRAVRAGRLHKPRRGVYATANPQIDET